MRTLTTLSSPLKPLTGEAKQYSSVAQTYDILSDAWLCLILQECFLGASRFEEFFKRLGLPRPTLTLRLKKMLDTGLLSKEAYQQSPPRYEYRLTEKGQGLYPTILAMHSFGERWLSPSESPTLKLRHITCGHPCQPIVVCSECETVIEAKRVRYRSNLAVIHTDTTVPTRRSRRPSNPTIYSRVRSSPFAQTLSIIGDRWTFLVIRELFYGVKRYDDFLSALAVATNILADRLLHLQEHDIIQRVLYQDSPPRHEYRLTAKGKDLYGAMLVMMHWADRWLYKGNAPLILRHQDCDQDFHAVVACNHCHGTLQLSNTTLSP